MSPTALKGKVVTDYGVLDGGALVVEGSAISEVLPDGAGLPRRAELLDFGEALILPGFIDLQTNGAFGVDVATSPERLNELSEHLLVTGTTSYLPAVITSPESLYEKTLPELARKTNERSGAEVLGVHLEGPFIARSKRGAHPASCVRAPDVGFLKRLLDLAPVRLLTLAPELAGAEDLMEFARYQGVVVSAGHSDAPFEAAYTTFDRHAASVTHLFNAMNALHHRAPGLPGAAFTHQKVVCGLIPDGLHVHPEVVALAFRMLGPDRIYLVTDAISAAGGKPAEYALATRKVRLEGGVPRLETGEISGSILTMNETFRNILTFTGCTIPEAARMTSATPARLVGEGRRKGRLLPGYDADVTVLAPDFSVLSVWKAGRIVYQAEEVVR